MGQISGPVIEAIDASCYVVPTETPEADGTLTWDATTLVLVTARSGRQTGIGWTYGARAAAVVVTDILAAQVVGLPATDVPAAAAAMARSVRNIGREGVASTAISAVDIALWDLKARLLGVSLAVLLGPVRADVPVYGSGGFTSYPDSMLREQLTGWVAGHGIPRVKIKIGESWGRAECRDLERVALAREVVGPNTELYVDANGGYRTGQALRVARTLAKLDVTWFEEPVSSQDLPGLALLRSQVEPDVTAGEYSWTLADSARLINAAAVDCLQLDVTRCGGITGFQCAAALAEAASLDVSAHCAPNLHVHVGAATPTLRHIEYFYDHQRIERMFFDGVLDPSGGSLTPDTSRPGHGLEFRAADARRYLTSSG